MTLAELRKCKYAVTHAGTFHADDIFGAAFLKLIVPDIEIIRTNENPKVTDYIMFDIGMGEFDHHMASNECRSDKTPYAAFGKLWRHFAPYLYDEKIVKKIDNAFIKHLDLSDNTGVYDSLCYAFSSFNPLEDNETGDKEFMECVSFAKRILENLIKKEERHLEEEKYVIEKYNSSLDKRVLVLDKHAYFKDFLPFKETIYVVYPSKRGGYSSQGVSKSPDTVELKKPFPEEWTHELPEGLRFCHNSRFLIAADTLEDIMKFVYEALDK